MKLKADCVSKHFQTTQAVKDLSFQVPSGCVFGLLGPNGAGKTTLIRMLLDIIKPDSGTILYDGNVPDGRMKDKISYLPEERGLYKKMKVADLLDYFARLKGLGVQQARANRQRYLERLNMQDTARQRIEELSKGNQQKIQVLSVLVSDPEVLVLDEPFAGLDPINTRDTKLLLQEERSKGKTIILSTHQMNQAEELCDFVLMINEGRRVLYGPLSEIVVQHSEDALLLDCSDLPDNLAGVTHSLPEGRFTKIYTETGLPTATLLRNLLDAGVEIRGFRPAAISLERIFIQVVQQSSQGVAA